MSSNDIAQEDGKTWGQKILLFLRLPYLSLTIVPLIWGSNFVIGKQLVGIFPPFFLTTARFSIAFLVLFPLFFSQRKRHIPEKITPGIWGLLILLGITGVFAFSSALYTGLRYTSSVNATLINAFNPTITVMLAVFIFKERLGGRQVAGIFIAFIGVVWIAVQGKPAQLLALAFNRGDLLMFLAAAFWAVYSIGIKKVVQKISPVAATTFSVMFGLLFLFPAAYIEVSNSSLGPVTWKSILALLYLGVFPSVTAFLLWNRGIAQVGPAKASMFYNLIPLFTVIMSYFFLGEIPRIYHIIGGILILWGMIWGSGR